MLRYGGVQSQPMDGGRSRRHHATPGQRIRSKTVMGSGAPGLRRATRGSAVAAAAAAYGHV